MSEVIARSSRECAGLHSAPVSRSLVSCAGIASVVVAISTSSISCTALRRDCRGPGRLRYGLLSGSRCHRYCSRGLPQDLVEQMQKLADLNLGNQKRRQQANRKLVRAVHQQSALERFGDKWTALDGKLDTKHATFTADLLDEVVFCFELLQPLGQFFTARDNIREQFFLVHHVQELQCHSADDRAAAESCAVQAGRDSRCNRFVCKDGSERESSSQWFCDHRDIRF